MKTFPELIVTTAHSFAAVSRFKISFSISRS